MSKYIIITPAHNEESYIRKTIESVISQSLQPILWIIVDDGSSDKTSKIAREYTQKYPWIKIISLTKSTRNRGGKVIQAFNSGVGFIPKEFDFIVKLDADLSLERDYFERLINQFTNNPQLGIASGGCYQLKGDKWCLEQAAKDHARGLSKVYRKKCFYDIGGLKPVNGWDTIDELSAQIKGWKTQCFNDLKVYHYRVTGSANGKLHGKKEMGRFSYYYGYHPFAFFLRCVYCAFSRDPFLIGGIAMLWGYFASWTNHEPRFDDPKLLDYAKCKTLKDALRFNRFR